MDRDRIYKLAVCILILRSCYVCIFHFTQQEVHAGYIACLCADVCAARARSKLMNSIMPRLRNFSRACNSTSDPESKRHSIRGTRTNESNHSYPREALLLSYCVCKRSRTRRRANNSKPRSSRNENSNTICIHVQHRKPDTQIYFDKRDKCNYRVYTRD